MNKNSISIMTPTYNSSKHISDTIQSVISQIYIDWELIIIDDYSNDDTIKIVESFILLDERIKLIINKNNKAAALSRNAGMRESKSDYLAFLDSDDIWGKDKLQKQLLIEI
jgi:teichuronic acid biosynthesis glycosyltransferase TuaG